MVKTEHIEYFLQIVKSQSISKAAKTLHLNHQHLSQIIAAMEKELGFHLLKRTYNGVTLTEEGQKALLYLEEMVKNYQILLTLAPNRVSEETVLPESFSIYNNISINPSNIQRVIQALNKQFPMIDMVLKESGTKETIGHLQNEKNALGYVIVSPKVPQLNIPIPPELTFIFLKKYRLAAWAAKDNPLLSRYKSISLKNLLNEKLVIYSPGALEENLTYQVLLTATKEKPKIKYIVGNLNNFYDLLYSSDCISVGTRRERNFDEKLAMLPIRDNIFLHCGLLVHRDILETPFIKAAIEIYQQVYQEA